MKKIVVFNQKGGVGKTTTAVNLSAALAKLGKKVLLVDFDPQGNASSGVGLEKATLENTAYTLISGQSDLEETIIRTDFENLYIIPSNAALSGAEIELVSVENREHYLKSSLSLLEAPRYDFDYVIIDSSPSLSLLSMNSMVAAQSILIPIQCEYYALEGLSDLINTYNLIKKNINSDLKLEGVLLTMYDSRTNLSKDVSEQVQQYFSDYLYQTKIPRNVKLAEAPSNGMPAIYYDPTSGGAQAYMELAEEVLKK